LKKPRKNKRPVRNRRWSADDVDTVSRARKRFRGHEEDAAYTKESEDAVFVEANPNSVVVSPYGKLAFVKSGDDEVLCEVGDALITGKSSILAPGDRVRIEKGEGKPLVVGVAPRTSKLSRPAVGRAQEQVLAANAEFLLIVAAAAKPPFRPGLVDRFLILADAGDVSPILCINKMDLVDTPPAEVENYRALGVPVFEMSCETGDGIDALRDTLKGKSGVLAGHSGVGKSTIINELDSEFELITQDVSDSSNKGRHTTTTARRYELADDITLIDTPGVREVGLWRIGVEELALYFTEIVEASSGCGFRDCTHIHEPRCAVLAAVEEGSIARARYDSYVRIRESLEED
jgi:ribosome biogenesis GTPase